MSELVVATKKEIGYVKIQTLRALCARAAPREAVGRTDAGGLCGRVCICLCRQAFVGGAVVKTEI